MTTYLLIENILVLLHDTIFLYTFHHHNETFSSNVFLAALLSVGFLNCSLESQITFFLP